MRIARRERVGLGFEALEERRLLSFNVNHTPYIQLGNAALDGYNSGFDQAEILWQTKGTQDADTFTAEFRESGAATWTSVTLNAPIVTGVDGRIVHSSTFVGLNFDDDYDYRITHLRSGSPIASYESTFHTRLNVSDSGGFTFATYGDSAIGSPPTNFLAVQSQINLLDPAFSLLLGDNVYNTGTHAEYDLRLDPTINAPLTIYNKNHIDYFGFGNHDVGYNSGQAARDSYSMPIPVEGVTSAAGLLFDASVEAEENYSFDYGLAHFLTFDTNNWMNVAALDKQLDWAVRDIQAARARAIPPQWVIVFGHHPITSLGGHTEHSPDDYYYDQVLSRLGASGVGADLLLFGHTHNYQRSYPLTGHVGSTATFVLDPDDQYAKGAGLPLVIQGTGGVGIGYGANDATFSDSYLAKALDSNTSIPAQFGFGRVDVTASQLTYRYINSLGQTLDTFTIDDVGDVTAPRATFWTPEDNGVGDSDPLANQVSMDYAPSSIQIRLWDIGGGIDDSTVSSSAVSLSRNGTPLVAGAEYTFGYDVATNLIALTPLGGSFGNGTYVVSLDSAIEDLADNSLAPTALTMLVNSSTSTTVSFRNGVDDYTAGKDTYLHEDDPTTNQGSNTKILVDGDNDIGTADPDQQRVQGLIRFDAMFDTLTGSRGGGPIPDGSTIVSATLGVWTGTSAGDTATSGNFYSLHRMLATWGESSTWDSMVGGVSRDDVEAASAITAILNGPSISGGTVVFDVTSDMQIWSNNSSLSTRGWLIHPLVGTDGWRFDSQNASTVARRPILTVVYEAGPTDLSTGSPYTITEGGSLILNGSATGSGLTYSWDLNGDNDYNDATGANPTVPWAQLVALGIADGPSTRVVSMRVSDGVHPAVTDSNWLTVSSVAPSATIAPGIARRGYLEAFTLTATDPSPTDQSADFTFDIDWDNDGFFDETVIGPSGMTVEHRFDGAGGQSVRVRATDEDGAIGGATSVAIQVIGHEILSGALWWYGTSGADSVAFEELSPSSVRFTESLLADAVVSQQTIVTVSSGVVYGVAHAGADEMDATQLVSISAWLDGGNGDDSIQGGDGADTIWGGLGNDSLSGGSGADEIFGEYAHSPTRPLSKALLGSDSISGGSGDDRIYGDGDGGEGAADVLYGDAGNDTIFGDGAEGSKLIAGDVIYGGADDDNIQGDGAEGSPDVILGGEGSDFIDAKGGHDTVDGGLGDDILLGGDGAEGAADSLVGGEGRDILIGDGGPTPVLKQTSGADTLDGGAGEDIVIAGLVAPTALAPFDLLLVRQEWTSNRPLSERIDNILGTGNTGVNGTSILVPGVNLFNDRTVSSPALVDIVLGGTEDDWIILDGTEDLAVDLETGDVLTSDLDLYPRP